jgi:cbb3-type cytochrome oxidase subunit 3
MKKTLRNIIWIVFIAVWSFLAGAYFHLGWVRNYSISYTMGFIMGGIAMWIVFSGIGYFVYRFTKKNGNSDPAKLALGVVTFFTICFLLISGIKYNKVQKDKFVEDMEYDFILHYKNKAQEKGIVIDNLDWELKETYSSISRELRKHPQLEQLMKQTTADAVFEENTVIAELCIDQMKVRQELGYPPTAGMQELFK